MKYVKIAVSILFVFGIVLPAFAYPLSPQLPANGKTLADFIPKDWAVFDSVILDFNHDGHADIVGVMEAQPVGDKGDEVDLPWCPRILFGIMNTGNNSYTLSFQDESAVRTSDEGGIWGDPYEPLAADGTSFTVSAYGGSNWRWAETSTYKYINEKWVLTQSSIYTSFMARFRDEIDNDYETGIGYRVVTNECGTSFEYTVKLPPPLELGTANSMNFQRLELPDVDYQVKEVVAANNINLDDVNVPPPSSSSFGPGILLINAKYIVYTFYDDNSPYLAIYHKNAQTVHVVASHIVASNAKSEFTDATIYDDRLYFCDIYKIDEPPNTINSAELISINIDGSNPISVFKYEENRHIFLRLQYELGGGEAMLSVFGLEPSPYYRINLESGTKELIGEHYAIDPDSDCVYYEDEDNG